MLKSKERTRIGLFTHRLNGCYFTPQVKGPNVVAVLFAAVGEAPVNEHGRVVESRGPVKSALGRDLQVTHNCEWCVRTH